MCVFVLSIHNWQGNLRLTVWPATLRICVFICIFVFVLSIRNWHSREICGLLFGLPPRVNWSIIINTLTNVTQWLGELSTHSQWLGENGHSWRNRRRNIIISMTGPCLVAFLVHLFFFNSSLYISIWWKRPEPEPWSPKKRTNCFLQSVHRSIWTKTNQPMTNNFLDEQLFIYKTIINQPTDSKKSAL